LQIHVGFFHVAVGLGLFLTLSPFPFPSSWFVGLGKIAAATQFRETPHISIKNKYSLYQRDSWGA